MKIPQMTTLALVASASIVPMTSNAEYIVQPVVKKDFYTNISPTILTQADFEVLEQKQISRDMRAGILLNDISVTLVSESTDELIVKISNNTMRRFSDINLDLGNHGVTVLSPLESFTELTVKLNNEFVDSGKSVNFLDPHLLFTPNSNEYREPLAKSEVETLQVLQNNLKVSYGYANTYETFMNFLTNTKDESRRNAWAKWHRMVSYNVPKSYRYTVSSSGVSGGSWHAIHNFSLKKYQTKPTFYHPYATLNHENAHSMGFKHGSNVTYGWQDRIKEITHQNDLDGITAQNALRPQTNDFFWDYDSEDKSIRLYAKEGSQFEGFEWINLIYDSNRTRIGDIETNFDTITLPASINTDAAVILLNAKAKGYKRSVNLTLLDGDVPVSSEEEFNLTEDPTADSYEREEAEHQKKIRELANTFPSSSVWAKNPLSDELARFPYYGEDRIVCKFNDVRQGLESFTVIGMVNEELDVCEIGENNSINRVRNASSEQGAYQTAKVSTFEELNKLTVYLPQSDIIGDVCFYSKDENHRFDGVGIVRGAKCSANKYWSMLSDNGKAWEIKKGWKRIRP